MSRPRERRRQVSLIVALPIFQHDQRCGPDIRTKFGDPGPILAPPPEKCNIGRGATTASHSKITPPGPDRLPDPRNDGRGDAWRLTSFGKR